MLKVNILYKTASAFNFSVKRLNNAKLFFPLTLQKEYKSPYGLMKWWEKINKTGKISLKVLFVAVFGDGSKNTYSIQNLHRY